MLAKLSERIRSLGNLKYKLKCALLHSFYYLEFVVAISTAYITDHIQNPFFDVVNLVIYQAQGTIGFVVTCPPKLNA